MANQKQRSSLYSAGHSDGKGTLHSTAATGTNTSNRQGTIRRPSAIVIGSGFSGLAAAHALHHASFEVVVLEARNRIGGRAFTDYSFGFPLDLGAAWLHGVSESNPLARLIADLQLPLYRTSGDDSVLYDHDLESYALYDEDGVKIPQDVVERVERVFEEMLEETRQICATTSEDMNMEHALALVEQRRPDLTLQGVERRVLQWYLCRMEGWFATDLKNLSAKCWEEEDLVEGGHGLMVNGYLPVLDALAAGLDIRFNHRVVNIDWSSSQDLDRSVSGGIGTAGEVLAMRVEATGVVGIENKIALLFPSCFWPSVEFLGVVADTPYACSYFLNLHKASQGERAVLVFMPAGRLAEEMEGMGESEAVAFTMLQLRKILPHAPEPIQARITTWGSDPFSLGSYSYDAVDAPPDVYDSLRAPLPPLFFAGEATSRAHPGTVHGAFSTGRQAAREAAEFVRFLGFGEGPRMVRKDESKKHVALLPQSVVSGGDVTGEESILSHVEAFGNGSETHNNSLEQGQVGDSSTMDSSPSSLTQHVVSGEIEAGQSNQNEDGASSFGALSTRRPWNTMDVSLPVHVIESNAECSHSRAVSRAGKALSIRISRL
ncbi:unnamed protein product [Closterium sp. NIES-64]|nr:unnamed protein product [Closterium sp. NIES-65]CAI5986775.1 unnamed protein product [Closterium sp. NIES-64]